MEEIRIDVEHIRPCLQEIHSSAQELIANLNLQIQVYTPQNYLDQIQGTSGTSNVQNQPRSGPQPQPRTVNRQPQQSSNNQT